MLSYLFCWFLLGPLPVFESAVGKENNTLKGHSCVFRYQLCSLVGWSIPWGRGWAQAVGAGHQADWLQTDGCILVLSPLPHQDESMGPSEHQDPISLAVEMAAVNHSILALSQQGRGGNDVKAEVLDDD